MRKVLLFCFLFVLIIVLGIWLLSTQSKTAPSQIKESNRTESTTPPHPTGLSAELPFPLNTPPGYTVRVYARNLGMARDLEITDGGTILVSDPIANTVTALLPSETGEATPKTILRGANGVHGLAYNNGKVFVADRTSVKRYSFNESTGEITFEKKIIDLPNTNLHNFRTMVFGSDNKLYISIGSSCNVCFETDPTLATVLVTDSDSGSKRVFAKGLRNAPFLAINPTTNDIWATEMGRDYLGDNLPPDEINILKDRSDYGWPICYGDKVHDTDFDKKQYIQDPCENTVPPIFEIPAHSAPLGLAFVPKVFNPDWEGDLIVAYHGSWNKSVKTGYKVVRMNVVGNKITGVETLIDGFLKGNTVSARPVDVLFDTKGSLYISDDKSGYIFVMRSTK